MRQTSRIYSSCITETSYLLSSNSPSPSPWFWFKFLSILCHCMARVCQWSSYDYTYTLLLDLTEDICLISQKCFLTCPWELETVHSKFGSKVYTIAYLLWLYVFLSDFSYLIHSKLSDALIVVNLTFSSIYSWLYPLTCWKGLLLVLKQATARLWYRDPIHFISWAL